MAFEEIKAGLERYCNSVEEKLKQAQAVVPRQYQKFYSLEAMNCYREDCLMRVRGAITIPFFCDCYTCPVRLTARMVTSTSNTTQADTKGGNNYGTQTTISKTSQP